MPRINRFRLIQWSLSTLYFSTLLYIVFFARRRRGLVWQDDYLNLIPITRTVHNYYEIPVQGWHDFYANLLGNILLFVPFPLILIILFRVSSKLRIIALGACVSIAIEATQYILQIGIPDIDDVILNTSGVVLGLILWMVLFKFKFIRRNKLIHRHSIS